MLGASECYMQVNIMVTVGTQCGGVSEFLLNQSSVRVIKFQTYLTRANIALSEKMRIIDVDLKGHRFGHSLKLNI